MKFQWCGVRGLNVRDINVLLSITLLDECMLLMSVCLSIVSVPGRLLSI